MARTLDQAKRTAILKAARAIFVRDGYASAKMADIASEAGVAPGTLYLYFDSKESLSIAIGEDFFERLTSQFGQVIKKFHGPEGIVTLLDWGVQIAVQERDIFALTKDCNPDSHRPPEGKQRFVMQLAEPLQQLMSHGAVRHYDDATILAELVLALLRRVAMAYAVFEEENAAEIKSSAVAMLQHALFDDVTLAAHRLVQSRTPERKLPSVPGRAARNK